MSPIPMCPYQKDDFTESESFYRCRYGTSESISSTMFGVANSYMQTQMLNNVKNLVTGGGAGGGGGSGGMQQTI